MDKKTYKLIIIILIVISIIFASLCLILFLNNKKCKCPKCEKKDIVKTTSKYVQSTTNIIEKDQFIVKSAQGCNLTVYKALDDENLLFTVSFCEMDGSADMKFKVNDKIFIKYNEVLETYPAQIIPIEIGYVK